MVQEKQKEVTLFNTHKQLIDIINTNHPLVQLADSIDWKSIEEELSIIYPSTTGHPNKPIRLMVGLHYLRYMFNLSDESIVWAYIENPYYRPSEATTPQRSEDNTSVEKKCFNIPSL